MATQSELAQIQHILGKRRNSEQNPLDLSSRKKSREYLDSHKDVEKRRRDRINTCLETIRSLVPLCHQLPRHRRVDKADLLDLAIIYLRMMNQFLDKIGVPDIFTAAHQQIGLFTSLEKWIREQGEKHADVATFTKEILGFLDAEMQTASQVVASQQTSSSSAPKPAYNGSSSEWMKREQDFDSAIESSVGSSDEESRTNSQTGSDDRYSGSEDSFTSSSNCVRSVTDLTKNPQFCFDRGDCGRSMGSSRKVKYRSFGGPVDTRYGFDEKPPCVDKAVNTDGNLTNFAWPSESTFTLPILSGKIVFHTPPGISSSNNSNAPVTLHAEIHSCPPPTQCKKDISNPRPASPSASCLTTSEPPAVAICLSSTEVAKSETYTDIHPLSLVTEARSRSPKPCHHPRSNPHHNPMLASKTPRSPDTFPQRRPPQEDDRKYSNGHSASDGFFRDVRDGDAHDGPMQAVPEELLGEDSSSRLPDVTAMGNVPRDAHGCCHKNGPFSKRYLANLCHQLETDNNNESGLSGSRHRGSFPQANSSMKLKSMMVHRHQNQHVPSR